MSIFDEKLRPEEVVAGFNPGEPDDDTMLLEKTGKYPGDFPYYQTIAPEPPSKNIATDEIIENPEGNIWDMITEDEIPAEVSPDPEPEPISEQIQETESIYEPEPTPEITQTEEEVWQDTTIPAFPESVDDANDKQEDTIDEIWEAANKDLVHQNEQVESGAISVDDELKNLLQAELEASQKKRKEKENRKFEKEPEQIEVAEIDPEQAKKSFKPVEEQEKKVDYIDFDKIDETKKGATDPLIPNVEGAKEVIKSKKTKSPKPPKPPKEKKERKKAGLLFWIASSVAGILIIAAASYFAINYFLNNYNNIAKDSTITKEKQLTKKENSKNNQSKAKEKSHKETEQSKKEEPANQDTTNKAKFEHNEGADFAHSEAKVDSKATGHKTDEPKVDEHSKELPKTEQKITEKPKSTEKEITPKKETEHKKVAAKKNTPSVTHNKPKVQSKKPKQTTTKPKVVENKTIEEPKTVQVPKVVKPTKAVYTIQVYSTPSYEDAQMWIKKLYSLSISNAYISTQKIRDVVWYRVRFGEYNDKQNAINDARKLGFSQTWVDRIK